MTVGPKTTAQSNTDLAHDFREQLARLSRAGYPLLPLGGGGDGKAPRCRDWAGPKLSLASVLAPISRTGRMVYGVRLDKLAVVDCDEDDPALVAIIEARFGPSPVHVKTPRGWHIYYCAPAGKVPNLRAEGMSVDIKTGSSAYVVGPISQRPDGGFYRPTKGLLGETALPIMRLSDRSQSASHTVASASGFVANGERHNWLVKEARKMSEMVDSEDELFSNLAHIRDCLCQDAGSMPDVELWGIVDWVWKCRLENRLFMGRDSEVRISRVALDRLRRLQNEGDCLALYVLLQDKHGHSIGKRFSLDLKSIRESELSQMSVPRLRAARRALQGAGLLKQVGNHRAGSVHQTFMLAKPLATPLGNVEAFPQRHPHP